jgi:hypothetical protein
MAAPEPAPAEAETSAPTPEPAPMAEEKTDFEKAQERYGAAYAIMADGLKGDGIDRAVKVVQYGIAAAAVFVIVAAVFSSV